ncbi:hypothetical protein [Haloprofundus salinisoli]|uniref:hypothetical protein n=1 Tax=Haloprofundus salinisoli TaxID=2876193 RepID=UPI001CD00EE5|nr:hypothetical protein [Haloprofundus salinisoli]
MASKQSARSRCLNCGYEAPSGGDEWDHVDVPRLGGMTRCPECGSTNVMSGR